MFLSLTLYLISLLSVIGLFLLSLTLDETLGQTYDIYGNLAGVEYAIFFFIGLGILVTFYRLRGSIKYAISVIIVILDLILTVLLIVLYYCLRRCFYYFLLLVCSPIFPIFFVLLCSFDDLAGLFANLIPTVYCEGVINPFPVVQQFTDLSSTGTKTLIREAYSEVSGIYMFQCTETGGTYIGSSINLYDRFYSHLNGINSNLHLQHAANKYGWDSFIFCVIETCAVADLITLEQSYLDILFNNSSKELVYNFCAVAYSMLGYTHTAEAKAVISAALSGRTLSAETKAAISAALSGRTLSAETKAAISTAQQGNTNRLGKTHTAENINLNRLNQPHRVSVFVYTTDRVLVNEFPSQVTAAEFLNVSRGTVRNYLASGKVLNNKYIIRTSPFP